MSTTQDTQKLTTAEWVEQYRAMKARADRSRASKRIALDRACREAGLGEYHGCVLHNAMVGLRTSRPWKGIDYSAARRAERIERSLFDADKIVSRWAARNRTI